jgi:hypothetical protein
MDSLPSIKSLDTFRQEMGISDSTLWRWRRQGILETTSIHGRLYITHEQAARFVARVSSGEFSKVKPVPPPPRKRKADNHNNKGGQ